MRVEVGGWRVCELRVEIFLGWAFGGFEGLQGCDSLAPVSASALSEELRVWE